MSCVKIFKLKFVDHDAKKTTVVTASVESGENIEWEHNEEDIEGYKMWLLKEADDEYKIKRELDTIIKSVYFPDAAKNAKLFQFADYVPVKMDAKSEFKAVNMNAGSNDKTVVFRQLMDFNMYISKFKRGNHDGKNWTDMFNYEKRYIHHTFLVNNTENGVKLTEVERHEVPQDKLKSYKSQKNDVKSERNTETSAKKPNNQAVLSATKNANNAASVNFPALNSQAGGKKYSQYY